MHDPPRLNHVALSLPSEALQPAGRAEIVDFYGNVFGWTEYPQLTEDGRRLVLGLATYDQFVFLVDDDDPLRAPRTDHFGLSVHTETEFDELLHRVKARMAADHRIHLDDHTVDDQEVVKIHSIYIRYLLPMMCELQFWEFPS